MLLDWPHSLLGLSCKRVWNSPVAHLQLLRQTSWPSGSLWPQQRGRQGHKAEATSSRSSALKRGEEERGLKPEACKFRINKSSFDTRLEKLFTVILSHTKQDIMTPSCNLWGMWQKTWLSDWHGPKSDLDFLNIIYNHHPIFLFSCKHHCLRLNGF